MTGPSEVSAKRASGTALAPVVDVLIEAPVMPAVVRLVNRHPGLVRKAPRCRARFRMLPACAGSAHGASVGPKGYEVYVHMRHARGATLPRRG